MKEMLQPLAVALPAGYLVSALLHGMAFGGVRAPHVIRERVWVLRLTLLAHLLWFWAMGDALQSFPVVDIATTVSAVVLTSTFLYAFLARSVKHAGSGGVVLGLAALLQLSASAFVNLHPEPRLGPPTPPLGGAQILHVSLSVIATASLLLSGVHGMLYLVLFRLMKQRSFGPVFEHLPDLDLLARMTRGAALVGFLCLTVGMNIGIYLAHREQRPGFNYRETEVVLSILVWIYFGVIAFSSRIKGFSARRASLAAALGLVVLLLSTFLLFFPRLAFHSNL
ncbi:MAG: cytochrome c biogenesis protein CcsA [Planctomycetes bacterium]|nr:cytochrome c biogenesis protein CcsA [Planctomycetota bacterium]